MQIADVDYYKVLGVSREASASDIKQKYRELSKKYHPDTSGGDTKRMSQINEAYAVLSDPYKRREYIPPSTKKSPAPSTYSKTTKHPQRSTVKKQPEPEEEPENQWFVFLSYVLAIPIAILVINVGLPAFRQILPKGKTVIVEEPSSQSSAQPSPQTPTPSSPSSVLPDAQEDTIRRSSIFYAPSNDIQPETENN